VLCVLGGVSVAHAVPVQGPHADLLASPFGCPACHESGGVIYASLTDDVADLGASDEPCVRCHVTGGDGLRVYGGDEAHYRVADGFGHNDPRKASCVDCHSIHGPLREAPTLANHLLKPLTYQPEAIAAVDARTAPHDVVLSMWCTGCHKQWPSVATAGSSPGHPFGPRDPGFAWEECTSCLSCHAAGSPGSFPHYTPGADAGLVSAGSSDAVATGAAERDDDGVCLRCHRSGGGPTLRGVGSDY
jgi:hypothetical protein